MQIIASSYAQIEKLRLAYLSGLTLFQELFLEITIQNASYYLLKSDETNIAYAIVNDEHVLLEFHIKEEFKEKSQNYFELVLKELNIKKIYCKSFDTDLLSMCELKGLQASPLGLLFRDFKEKVLSIDAEINYRNASEVNIPLLMQQDESIKELFETEEQLHQFIQKEKVILFRKHNQLIGCGMIIKTHQDWNFCDLGVWVHPDYRKKGIGAQIILHLKSLAEANELIPSCGCAIDNIASQKTLERSGFISKHQMLSFTI